MELEALKHSLASLNINPDEIKVKDIPMPFTFSFISLKNRMKRLNSSREITRNFEMKSIYSKVNKPNLRFVALKRMKTFLLKKRGYYSS